MVSFSNKVSAKLVTGTPELDFKIIIAFLRSGHDTEKYVIK